MWPKWPCPKVPFPLRAKRARKAQNGTGTVPSRDGFANFSGREMDFEPPPQARRAGEDDELPRGFERFLQTGQPEDEPYY